MGPTVLLRRVQSFTKDVPPNTVVAGNPAKVVGTIEEFVEKHRAHASYTLNGMSVVTK